MFPSIPLCKGQGFDERADRFWEGMKSKIQYTLFRNSEFLNWRFCDHPRVDYCCLLALRGGEVAGLCVYRIGWIGEKITPLVELFTDPDDEAAQAALVATAARHGVREDHPRMELWYPPSGRWFQAFASFGFEKEPTRFPMINRLFADWMNEEWLMEHYFFTMGDSDIY